MVINTECNCGGEDCDSGKYCVPSVEGLDTCSEFPPKCSGSGATDIPCQCSNTVCKFGEHCYDDKCNSEPEGTQFSFYSYCITKICSQMFYLKTTK